MATYRLTNTAAQVNQAISRAFDRIGPTANNASNFGVGNTASGNFSCSIGYNNISSANSSSSFGIGNTASSLFSSALGYFCIASGVSASAVGHLSTTNIDETFEAGYWIDSSSRGGAIRMHPNGQAALTIADDASAPTDGGATAGSEANGTLPRGMFTIQKNGNAVTLYYNNAGTIQSLSLGTLS